MLRRNYIEFLLLLAALSSASARIGDDDVQPASPSILRSVYSFPTAADPHSFVYSFETDNGIRQAAAGEMRKVGEADVVVMRGSYEYVGEGGRTYTVEWYADETGFHPKADHLPKAPAADPPAVEVEARFGPTTLPEETDAKDEDEEPFPPPR